MNELRINYQFPIYTDQLYPKGFLKLDRRYHAMWTYYVLSQKLLETAGNSIDDQIIEEGMAWMDKPYAQLATSTAMRYGLADPGEFLREPFMRATRLEAARLGLPTPAEEYMNVQPGTTRLV